MKIQSKILILTVVISCFLTTNAFAAGIVPCGQRYDDANTAINEQADCTLCHFFVLVDSSIDFLLVDIAPPLALLMIVIGGGMFILASGNPQTITRAKKVITSTLIGVAIIYGAYTIVGLFLQSIGLSDWALTEYSDWWETGMFEVACDVPMTDGVDPNAADRDIGPEDIVGDDAPADDTGGDDVPETILDPFDPPLIKAANPIEIVKDKILNKSGNLYTFHTNPIYSMYASGTVNIIEPDGYVRIILSDKKGNEYLIYEASGPFDSGSFFFEDRCEETCVLDGMMPGSVDVELKSATIQVKNVSTIEDEKELDIKIGIKSHSNNIKSSQNESKLKKIQKYIKDNNLKWTAGKTSISGLSYSEKKNLFILPTSAGSPSTMPGLQGFSYYWGGVFEMPGAGILQSPILKLPKSFSWQNRHGENWMTPIRSQGQCGSCWSFSASGSVEATTNLYFNQHLDLNLSEQELVSCMKSIYQSAGFGGDCYGDNPNKALDYYRDNGVSTEGCFPYRAFYVPCNNMPDKCSDEKIKIKDKHKITLVTEKKLKEAIVQYGPISTGILSLYHAMTLVGWETDPSDNNTIWIFKNSWDTDWGNEGYVKIKMPVANFFTTGAVVTPIFMISKDIEIKCTNKDKDNYCNWGISNKKPATCPASCGEKRDCDDSNATLGAFDENFNCIKIDGGTNPIIIIKDTTSPVIKNFKSSDSTSIVSGNKKIFSAHISDNDQISKCELMIDSSVGIALTLSDLKCINCTASGSYSFDSSGSHHAHIKCWDISGNDKTSHGIIIKIDNANICPDCNNHGFNSCISPPSCDKNCDADFKCDQKLPGYKIVQNDYCYWCSSRCKYYSDPYKPNSYYLTQEHCSINCDITCKTGGWTRENCEQKSCLLFVETNNICKYERMCSSNGCNYDKQDSNKICQSSLCTKSGWNNSSCNQTPVKKTANWMPCDPSSNWKCGNTKYNSNSSCEGTRIGWGLGKSGEIPCPQGTIATSGSCQGKDSKDSSVISEARVSMVPSLKTFSNSTIFKPQSSWYCKFKCSGLFCGADGCAWATCEAGDQSIGKIELEIYHISLPHWKYKKTFYNQSEIIWNRQDNSGKRFPNGACAYRITTSLKNGKTYNNIGTIKLTR